MPVNPKGQYTRIISRFDQFPYQVQAFREERWCVISCHSSAPAAQRGLRQIQKCRPTEPDHFRIVSQSDPDNYIWADPSNKPN